MFVRILSVSFLLTYFCLSAHALEESKSDKTDILDVFSPQRDIPPAKMYKLMPSILPAIASNPANGLLYGVVGNAGMYLGSPDTTPISEITLNLIRSTQGQTIITMPSDVITNHKDWELIGDWRYYVYNQSTYGLGNGPDATSSGAALPNGLKINAEIGAQPMSFSQFRVYELFVHRIAENVYLGGAYQFDHYSKVVDQNLTGTPPSPQITAPYAYNSNYGFDVSQQTVSGASLAALYDSRDSTINAYRGSYGLLQVTANPTFLGSSVASGVLHAEARTYLATSEYVPRNILALSAFFDGIIYGAVPYLSLPSTGWGANSTRGYTQGRFRGTQEIFSEAEWRYRITENGLLGGVFFTNVETFASPQFSALGYVSPETSLLQTLDPGVGTGLRVLLNRDTRTNADFDVAYGREGAGFWMNLSEYF